MLLTIILIIVLLNLAGGFAPGYRSHRVYGPSWGAIIVIILVLYFLGYLHS